MSELAQHVDLVGRPDEQIAQGQRIKRAHSKAEAGQTRQRVCTRVKDLGHDAPRLMSPDPGPKIGPAQAENNQQNPFRIGAGRESTI
jgi:hypothetical protein